MNIAEALQDITLLGIDSVALIYLVERHPVYFECMVTIAQALTQGSLNTVSASLALTEVLVHPLRRGNTALVREYEDILQNSVGFRLVALTPVIARQAAELRADYNLKTPDAIHIATAIETGCNAFLTNDAGLKRLANIRVLILDDLHSNPQPSP